MAKSKSVFYCQNCGTQSPKWVGKCTACHEWNTYVEEVVSKDDGSAWKASKPSSISSKPTLIKEVSFVKEDRVLLQDRELNRVLGGGIVPGSVTLIGGEPGIGKSTLLLQLALHFTAGKIIYVSGEESNQQIKMRADRMKLSSDSCYLLAETSLENIFKHTNEMSTSLLIIDSIQTLQASKIESSAGSVSQVRECTGQLIKFAKETNTPVFLIGHITKDGAIAGPKVLEHMVDTVLQFEGDRHHAYRILRTTKNRFGSTSELGIYEMLTQGMRTVENPSELLISNKDSNLSGVAIGAAIEGSRPLLIETQALVSIASYGTAQRSSTGYDAKRLNMLLAVLEKRGGLKLGDRDVFLNIAGGFRIDDPALDLSICVAIVSSYEDRAINQETCFAGEIGLGGEVRAVSRIENRISEAEKLGFKQIIISKHNLKGLEVNKFTIGITPVNMITEVFKKLAT